MKRSNNLKAPISAMQQLALVILLLISNLNSTVSSAQCLVNSLTINTGYDPLTGTVITGGVGSQDPKWQVSALSADLAPIALPNVPVYQAYVTGADWDWVTSPSSGWIGIIPDYWYATDGDKFYQATFRRTFTTCLADVIKFSINIANDNYCPQIRVDGVPVPPSSPFSQPAVFNPANYNTWNTVPGFAMSLSAGTHTIEVDIVNIAVWSSFNPHGLNIVGNVSSSTGINSIVSETSGCTEYSCCNANFQYCMNTTHPYTVDFTADDPSLPFSSYTWTVNGSPVGSGSSLTYIFPGPGSYKVCLNISDRKTGRNCSKCFNVCIADNPGMPSDGKARLDKSNSTPAKNSNLKIYPNPTSNILNIELNNSKDGKATIRLFDASGKLVSEQQKELVTGSQKIDISTAKLASGIYMLELTDGNSSIKQRVVKE